MFGFVNGKGKKGGNGKEGKEGGGNWLNWTGGCTHKGDWGEDGEASRRVAVERGRYQDRSIICVFQGAGFGEFSFLVSRSQSSALSV